jgi:hypothetical protein
VIKYPHPPTRGDYEGAVARLALLDGATPPKTVVVPARPGDGKSAPDVEANPAYSAYVQAQASAAADRDLVRRYEEFSTKYAHLYEDTRGRVDRGGNWPTSADREFVRVFETHLDAQPQPAEAPSA